MTNRFQILSLDGGGIKGIFSAALLSHLEDDFSINITDHFDLIVGTSTGGIIALGLATGMRPQEIVEFYVKKGPEIFGGVSHSRYGKIWSNIRRCLKSKYDSSPLRQALRECFRDKKLSDCTKCLVIPSYNIGEDDVYLFKTPHHERLRRDYKEPIWKVAMATSAAPTFFPCFREVDDVRLIDGGVWANNPTMVGIIEAISLFDVPLEAIRVLSLGTTDPIKGRASNLDNGGLWQWKKEAIEVIMRGQSISANTQALHLLGKDRICRLDPKVPDSLFALDKLSVNELKSKASHESRHFSPVFKSMFMDHEAPRFHPFHPKAGDVYVKR